MFSRSQSTEQNELRDTLCWRSPWKLLSGQRLGSTSFFFFSFLDKAFIARDQGWAISLLIQQKPGIRFVCPDVFLFGFLHHSIEIKSWMSVLWMGRGTTIYEVWGCMLFSSKAQPDELGERKCCTVWPQQANIWGNCSSANFWKREQEGMVLIVSCTWGCMGRMHQMRETTVIKNGLHSNKTCRAFQLASCLLPGIGDGWTGYMCSI